MAIVLARYFADGDLDWTFGEKGVVRTADNNSISVSSIRLGPQGQIMILAESPSVLHRISYSADGSVVAQSSSSPFFPNPPGSSTHPPSQVLAATVWTPPIPVVVATATTAGEIVPPAADGTRLIAAGWANINGRTEIAVASYLLSGALDAHFGSAGQFSDRPVLANTAQARGLSEGSDGHLFVVGSADSFNDLQQNLMVLKLRATGSLDPSFSQDGRVLTRFPGASSQAVAVASDGAGNVVAVGTERRTVGSEMRLAMVKYQAIGNLDQGFGQQGLVTARPPWTRSMEGHAVTIDGHARIVVVGEGDAFGLGPTVMVARFLSDGKPDKTFGPEGFAPPGLVPSPASATSVHVDPVHGKITVAGSSNGQFCVIRLRDGGGVAPFGVDGAVFIRPSHPNEQSRADVVAVDAFGRIVAAGVTSQ